MFLDLAEEREFVEELEVIEEFRFCRIFWFKQYLSPLHMLFLDSTSSSSKRLNGFMRHYRSKEIRMHTKNEYYQIFH